jgi:hypothetical protein
MGVPLGSKIASFFCPLFFSGGGGICLITSQNYMGNVVENGEGKTMKVRPVYVFLYNISNVNASNYLTVHTQQINGAFFFLVAEKSGVCFYLFT